MDQWRLATAIAIPSGSVPYDLTCGRYTGVLAPVSPPFFFASAGYDVLTGRPVIGDCTAVPNRFARQCWWSGLLVELTTMAVGVEAEEVTIPEAAVRAATIAELLGQRRWRC